MEPYLYLVKESKYRIEISRLRASSHVLEIERGRYTRPKTPITERLCPFCNVVEDEQHFKKNQEAHLKFFSPGTTLLS